MCRGFNFLLELDTNERTCLKGPLNSAPTHLPIYMPKKRKGCNLAVLVVNSPFSGGADPEAIVSGWRSKSD